MEQPTSTQRDTSSASSSSFSSNGPYQVFINHRGPDVKKSFASFLYRELKSKRLQVFLDQPELEPGHIILSQIKAAIKSASVQIAIFSKTYAESTWCLDELVDMLETTQRATILPVFYGVKPSELRRTDRGAYANAMRKHKQRYHLETIEKWKKALSDAADISGFELEACNGDEMELVDMVVQRVLKEFPKQPPLFVANHKIGLQEKLEDFERTVLSRLEGQDRLEAKVVGIVGSGGIGKSTLAREFFNRKRSTYKFSSFSFLFDVRENARTKSLTHLQRELIKDIKGIDVQIKSWEEGIGIQKNLNSSHALIILDDVDHRDQLNALLPIKHVLDPMSLSLILITSRDKRVLRTARIVGNGNFSCARDASSNGAQSAVNGDRKPPSGKSKPAGSYRTTLPHKAVSVHRAPMHSGADSCSSADAGLTSACPIRRKVTSGPLTPPDMRPINRECPPPLDLLEAVRRLKSPWYAYGACQS